MYSHHFPQSKDQPGKVANPARGQLNRENEHFPVPVRGSPYLCGPPVVSEMIQLLPSGNPFKCHEKFFWLFFSVPYLGLILACDHGNSFLCLEE